ncbi:MAG: hypothetical protein QM503_04530 [Bacteroidota bacterium]
MKKIPFDKNTQSELQTAQITAFKKEYGEVFLIKVEDKKCYLHPPTRTILDAASAASKKAESKFNEVILRSCWLAGDKELVDDDDFFMAASSQLGDIIKFKEATIKKL